MADDDTGQANAPVFILVHPQMGENIGAAARVMGNFGLPELRLVAPRDGWPNPAAEAMSAGSPVHDYAKLYDGFDAAIADLDVVYATTARPRGMVKPVATAREAMANAKGEIAAGSRVGVLFGAEKSGLPNEAVNRANAILTLPVEPGFASLNLAQACGVVAYEWRAGDPAPDAFAPLEDRAGQEELERLYVHFEDELERAGFFYPPEKTPLMKRNLRNIFARGGLTEQEVRTLRGAIKALAVGRGKYRVDRE
ncbi:rRNA methyltransferase [Marinicauda salina]|uniref:rRNA methyltransferase n=1 Tax=Marinicauda salina TaxID=2135793 RepID=A0A2U2BU66_9PROT|nr:RNA methyltransferase [Marinicauda salina]PWE17532.1 rRNA methyltransferase [Marinicauda salina]